MRNSSRLGAEPLLLILGLYQVFLGGSGLVLPASFLDLLLEAP